MPVSNKKVVLTQGELKALAAGRTNEQIGEAIKKMVAGGRRRHELDLDKLVQMRMAGCTISEIAAEFGVTEKTIDNRLRDEPLFRDLYDRGEERGKAAIRIKQWRKAVFEGDSTMLIWAGKQRLGQREHVDPARHTDRLDEVLAALTSGPPVPPAPIPDGPPAK